MRQKDGETFSGKVKRPGKVEKPRKAKERLLSRMIGRTALPLR